MDGDGCVLHGDVAAYAYAVHRVSCDRDGKASRSTENDAFRGHDAYIVVEGDLVTSWSVMVKSPVSSESMPP